MEDSFGSLGESFYTRVDPSPLAEPYLVASSGSACALIGVDPASLQAPESVAALAGNALLPGSRPLAAVYAGHQFGIWAGRLGDGRALLLGDTPARKASGYKALGGSKEGLLDFDRWELQLKGSGVTPYSRMADGRAVLRSSIREFLCSEAMAALGIPTTRALAVTGSDVPVFREDVETAAVVLRMSPSFVRFGSFEYFYYASKHDQLKVLADYVIAQFYPELSAREDRYALLLSEVTARTAWLMAKWQAVGFCHGVMNTDNMSVLGLTIDYGPFGFLDAFESDHICNHSDEGGRYAYSQQPDIGEWNCFVLGQSLVPLIGSADAAVQALQVYKGAFEAEYMLQMRAKLGLVDSRPEDADLLEQLFAMLERGRADFTLFFRGLGTVRQNDAAGDTAVRDLCIDREDCDRWLASYRARLETQALPDEQRRQAMNRVNPRFVLRNHLAEEAIRQANRALANPPPERDFSEVRRLAEVLSRPFDEQPENDRFAALPPDWARSIEVSCSS
ncbi:MAG TPA: YdiU family protein [Lautropia sp.]|nr:YdiU family protein [Lautropia sp.]